MEQSGRNLWQMGKPKKRLEQANTVATGCDQLPIGAHGKEGVDGSSPSEGFAEVPEVVRLSTRPTPVTRGHLRARCDVRTWFARRTGVRLARAVPVDTVTVPAGKRSGQARRDDLGSQTEHAIWAPLAATP